MPFAATLIEVQCSQLSYVLPALPALSCTPSAAPAAGVVDDWSASLLLGQFRHDLDLHLGLPFDQFVHIV